MRRSQNSHRKRPHVLPPMPNSQTLLRPMDPLMPPDLLLMENRLGSPAPKPVSRDGDYDFNASNGRPAIKVSDHEETPRRENGSRESMRMDLLSDPFFSNDNDLFMKIQKRNAFKASEGEEKWHDRENYLLNNFSRNQLKNLRNDLDKKLRCSSIRPLEENLKVKCPDIKIVQIPNRYAPLKPIGQKGNDREN